MAAGLSAERKRFIALGVWVALSVGLPLGRAGLSSENVTRLAIIGYLGLSLTWYACWGRRLTLAHPRRAFIAWSTLNALVGEAAYLISKPLHPSLLINAGTPAPQALRNLAVDWALTAPAYLAIFTVVWALLTRYRYSPFSYLMAVGLGQSLGDGNAYFLANPAMLLFVPYVMLNYWAMSLVPYLVVRPGLEATPRSPSRWKPIVVPLVVLPVTYLAVAAVILTAGKLLGWLPAD